MNQIMQALADDMAVQFANRQTECALCGAMLDEDEQDECRDCVAYWDIAPPTGLAVLHHGNEGVEEVNQSVLDAEVNGDIPRRNYAA